MPATDQIMTVVLAGGGGTRAWPLSRDHYPKQFLAVGGGSSLRQQTLEGLPSALALAGYTVGAPLVVGHEGQRFLVAEQCCQAGLPLADLIFESVGRNSAPALSVAALRVQRDGAGPIRS